MRLIDADLSKVMFMQRARLVHYGFADRLCVPCDAVDEVPTVGDAVLVVRCKDCVYWREAVTNDKGFLICPASGMEITESDFCSYGERGENNGVD